MATDPLLKTYEQSPYPDLCYTQTHPNRLGALAALLGRPAAPVDRCRVLELGCAGGGNLVPMAYALPHSSFVGVDFAAAQISRGQVMIEALGLENVTLQALDIMEIDAAFGQFDYIIAHGVYSWVPPQVREKVMVICRQNLAPNGIAYVSYNTYPGWHMLGALREMMLYRTRHTTDPQQKVAQARELLDFLGQGADAEDPYSTFSQSYRQLLQTYQEFVTRERQKEQHGDELWLHDELETFNTPVYFHQFMAHAQRYHLQYLVEADFARVMTTHFAPEVQRRLAQLADDAISLEQYMDFLRNRTFRQTLLCHAQPPVQRRLQGDLSAFAIATYARPETADLDVHAGHVARFRGPDGATIATDHPVSQAALLYLGEVAPTAVPFPELLVLAQQRVYGAQQPEQAAGDAAALTGTLLRAYSYSVRLVELHIHAPQFVLEPGQRPLASAVARWQAAHDNQKVSNLRHERVRLDPISQYLLPRLDGMHERSDLLALLQGLAAQGRLQVEHEGEPITDPETQRQILAQDLEQSLRWLGRAALLHA